MGIVQKDAFRTMSLSYIGIALGYLNKGLLFLIILSTEQIGLVNLLVSVGTLFAQFANLGTVYTTWKFAPFFRNKEKKNHGFLPLMLLIALFGAVLFTLLALIFRQEVEDLYLKRSELFVDYYLWIIPIGIAYVFFLVFEVYLRSFYKNIVAVVANDIILRISLTALLGLLWFDLISFDSFVILHSIFYFIPTIILIVYLYQMKELNLNFRSIQISKRFRSILIQFSAFNYINTLGFVIVSSLDVMMIAQMVGLEATGIYSTMVFFTSALLVPYKSMHRISVPLVADHWKHREMDKMQVLYRKFSSVSLVIGLAFFLWVWLSVDILFGFLKPEFLQGIWVFFFLMMGKLLDMYCGLNGSIFVTSKKYKYDILFTLFLIAAVFVMNLYFIPVWGIIGAAISTAAALLVYNLGRVIFVWYYYKLHPFESKQFVVIALAVSTALTGLLTADLFEHALLQFILQSSVVLVLFIAPVYFFRLEPETIAYIHKGTSFLKKRLYKK
jgi:O-antigen/teichoic acid export membrane protein